MNLRQLSSFPIVLALACTVNAGCGKKETPAPAPVVASKDRTAPVVTPPKVEPPKVEETGRVKVEFDVAVDPKSIISVGGNEYARADLEKEITLKAGKHALLVRQADLVIAPKEIHLDKGARIVVRVFDAARKAVERILEAGGNVRIVADGKEVNIKSVKELPTKSAPVVFASLRNQTKAGDADLEYLYALTSVKRLDLWRAAVTDAV